MPMATQKQPPKPNKVLRILAIVAGVGVTLVLLAVLASWLSFRHLRNSWTSDQPRQFTTTDVDRTQTQKLGRIYGKARQAVELGRAETIEVSGPELNQLLAVVPEWKDLSQRLSLAVDGDLIVASTSLQLHDVPGLEGRYVNGDFTIAASAQDGKINLNVNKVMVGDKPLPDFLLKKINERNLGQLLMENNSPWLRQLDALTISDGKVVVKTRQGRQR